LAAAAFSKRQLHFFSVVQSPKVKKAAPSLQTALIVHSFWLAHNAACQFIGQRKDNKGGILMSILSLRELQPGNKGKVVSISAQGEMGRRIRDMGLLPGTEVEVVGCAPLGDPVALRLIGITVALRNNEADNVTVEALL